ncbi:MAG: cobalamin biosynthesis protein, partial [Kiloniellales bacterium]
WVNFVPARIAGALICAAAAFHPDGTARLAWDSMLRDAPRHRSPNAGWQEAALAGALGFALAGPRRYGETTVDDAWMGDGRRGLTSADLRAAIQLYRIAVGLLAIAVALLLGLLAVGL